MTNQHLSPQTPANKPRLFYGYIVVATGFIIQILTWGTFNCYGIFFNPLLGEFGWSRATISGAISLGQMIIGIGAITLGNLNDRFGPRILMAFSGLLAGLGYLLMSQVNSVWQLYFYFGLIVGFGISGSDVILLSTTARWFIKRRGMMSGIVKIGTGVGIMLMPLLVAWLISDYGWRNAYLIVGIIVFVCVISGAQLLRRDPAQMRQLPDGEVLGRSVDVPPIETGLTLSQAVRTRRFWMFCPACFTILYCTMTIIVHLNPYIVDLGFSPSFGAIMISTIGGASIIGRLAMGIAVDRVGSKRALLICFVILSISFCWLLLARELWGLSLFAVVYGFCHGGFYAVLSPTVAEFFGMRSHGFIFGIALCIGSVGGSVGPFLTGHIYDATGSYYVAFLLLLALAITGFMLILASGSVRWKENNQPEYDKDN